MGSSRTTQPRIGLLSVEVGGGGLGESIPIYGVREMSFNRSTNWRADDASVSGVFVMDWKGDNPTEFAINFELVAGMNGDIRTRKDLFTKIAMFHSMCAGQYGAKDGANLAPPLVRYILGEYINAIGVVKDANVIAKGPWGTSLLSEDTAARAVNVGSAYPTAAVFTGTFLVVPGYTAKGQNVVETGKTMSSAEIRSSFYKQKAKQ